MNGRREELNGQAFGRKEKGASGFDGPKRPLHLAGPWRARRVDHLVQGQWTGLVTHLCLAGSATPGDVPGKGSRQDIDIRADLLQGLTMGARQPVLTCFTVAADTGIESFARRAVVACASYEKEVAPFVILQGQTYS
jgi:hypothetical protein